MTDLKINESQGIGAYRSYNQTVDLKNRGVSSPKKKDEVQISSEAKELAGAQGLAGSERADKIQSLKTEVASGAYFVDSGKIAEKLLPYLK
ncbi:flagellar biosynthesis anti-sigma factor FlgM [Cohnella fermenti]|uniref:Negative regulator of flagellin synthesis n=1 Tax=Cohnella fermenti TaxID=2565925 RepID=A0A4S4C537_9BACL|nr:flagellar biosynthesis anti-sigma factor FlgM [Cohnella fermenti]THF80811.1 flagellar biosynthesis anti-sigma factor FlgM [Cohnella fermenti]